MPDGSGRRLGDTGQVYVTLRAAEEYAAYTRLMIEEARRELTIYALQARPALHADREQWRHRSRSSEMDITVFISREDGLAVVTHVHVRPY